MTARGSNRVAARFPRRLQPVPGREDGSSLEGTEHRQHNRICWCVSRRVLGRPLPDPPLRERLRHARDAAAPIKHGSVSDWMAPTLERSA